MFAAACGFLSPIWRSHHIGLILCGQSRGDVITDTANRSDSTKISNAFGTGLPSFQAHGRTATLMTPSLRLPNSMYASSMRSSGKE